MLKPIKGKIDMPKISGHDEEFLVYSKPQSIQKCQCPWRQSYQKVSNYGIHGKSTAVPQRCSRGPHEDGLRDLLQEVPGGGHSDFTNIYRHAQQTMDKELKAIEDNLLLTD
jgi:hypothetical protein